MTRWYRTYDTTKSDKIAEAALVAGCSRSTAIASWHAILESCAAVAAGGKFDTTPRRVAAVLGEPPATIEAVFSAFGDLGMIADGVACSWGRLQYESDSSTERSRRHRAKASDVPETPSDGDATLHQRCATATEQPQIQIQSPEANASGGPTSETSALWREGVDLLRGMGLADRQARSNVGRWLSACHDDAGRVLGAIRRARDMETRDPVPLVTRLLSPPDRANSQRTAANVLAELQGRIDSRGSDDRRTIVPAVLRL